MSRQVTHGWQGDVNLIAVNEIPNNAKKVKRTDRGYVLAEGEVTGHTHRITADVDLYEVDGVLYLKNDAPVEITHEEHHPVTVPPGKWKVGITREFDHLQQEARNVAD